MALRSFFLHQMGGPGQCGRDTVARQGENCVERSGCTPWHTMTARPLPPLGRGPPVWCVLRFLEGRYARALEQSPVPSVGPTSAESQERPEASGPGLVPSVPHCPTFGRSLVFLGGRVWERKATLPSQTCCGNWERGPGKRFGKQRCVRGLARLPGFSSLWSSILPSHLWIRGPSRAKFLPCASFSCPFALILGLSSLLGGGGGGKASDLKPSPLDRFQFPGQSLPL